MERRSIAELISEAEGLLNDSRSRIDEERKVIAHRKAIGADLAESEQLLANFEMRANWREWRLCYLRRLAGR